MCRRAVPVGFMKFLYEKNAGWFWNGHEVFSPGGDDTLMVTKCLASAMMALLFSYFLFSFFCVPPRRGRVF
jgi:hypothetical protein